MLKKLAARGSWYQRFCICRWRQHPLDPSNQTAEVVSGVVTAGSGIENVAETLQFEGFNPPDLEFPMPEEREASASEGKWRASLCIALMERLTFVSTIKKSTDLACNVPSARNDRTVVTLCLVGGKQKSGASLDDLAKRSAGAIL